MGSAVWVVAAASIGAVEALKDMGFERLNYSMSQFQQHVKANLTTYAQAAPSRLSAPSSALVSNHNKKVQSEESLRKVMFLSCWGPNT